MLWWFAQTTLIAGALAIVAIAAGRWRRLGPEVRHALWLLVLIKLAIPPLVAWPWSLADAWPARVEPAPAPVVIADRPAPPFVEMSPPEPEVERSLSPEVMPASPSPPEVAEGGTTSVIADPQPIAMDLEVRDPAPVPPIRESEILGGKPRFWDWNSALLAAWLAGSTAVVIRRGVKVFRFHRTLRDAQAAPGWLIEETRAIGDRVGVRPPSVVATHRVATPLLWCLGRPRLVLPETLIKRLDADRWPGILAHELAHLARGDHWVARLELLVEAAWWWNPLFWLARRRLHEEAELACDARVVRSWPERRYAYAEALVDVCEHIARSASIPSPALGVVGAGATHTLEGRLNMILQEPVSRRSSRRTAPLALLLAALALPTWTLGQQPDTPTPKPEQDAPTSPKPDTPKPSKPDTAPIPAPVEPPSPEATPAPKPADDGQPGFSASPIAAIQMARLNAVQKLRSLSFRYVVAGRDFSRPYSGGGMGGMGGGNPYASMMMGGGPGGVPAMTRGGRGDGGMASMMGGGQGGMGGSLSPTTRRSVQVADVLLSSLNRRSRYDVIKATPAKPDEPRGPLAWTRRLAAKNEMGYLILDSAWDKQGPVPFRWLGATDPNTAPGDSLTALFVANSTPTGIDPEVDPLDPRPANLLDLAGATALFLDFNHAKAEAVGLETMDGQEVVRVAWIANGDLGVRGLVWFAPKLGYAVVSSVATMDPNGIRGRRSWRKRSSDFVAVADTWLPRKVTYEELEANPGGGGDPISRRERDITFEDFQVFPILAAETFRPKLAIRAIDDASGHFTAEPPEIPAGLVDRLKRAVLDSKFGPPGVEMATEYPAKPAASVAPEPTKPAPVEPSPAPSAKPTATAKSDPENRDVADKDLIDGRVERMFKTDPEVVALVAKMKQARTKLDKLSNTAIKSGEPAEIAAMRELKKLTAEYDQLWETRSTAFREQIARVEDDHEPIEVLKARRDGKLAEMRKAEAQRGLAKAVVARNANLKAKGPNFVSNEETVKGEAEWQTAEAEVAIRKAALDEADAYLKQARRRLGISTPEKTTDPTALAEPKRPAEARPNADLGESGEGRRPPSQDELRDAVEVLEVQLQGKRAQLRAAESVVSLARRELENTQRLFDRKGVSETELGLHKDKADTARAESEAKQAEVQELEVRLKHARRRVETNEATLKREVERAKVEVSHAEKQFASGAITTQQVQAARARLEDLMIQLDPKFVPPAPASVKEPAPEPK